MPAPRRRPKTNSAVPSNATQAPKYDPDDRHGTEVPTDEPRPVPAEQEPADDTPDTGHPKEEPPSEVA